MTPGRLGIGCIVFSAGLVIGACLGVGLEYTCNTYFYKSVTYTCKKTNPQPTNHPITTQPNSTNPSCENNTPIPLCLLDNLEEKASLSSLQYGLCDLSTQVSNSLRKLVLIVYKNKAKMKAKNESLTTLLLALENTSLISSINPSKKQSQKNTSQFLSPLQFFSSIDYQNMKEGSFGCSGQIRATIDFTPKFTIGFAYEKKDKGDSELQTNLTKNELKMKMVTNSFSSIAVWNPNEPGFSGHVATSYGWGTNKSFR